MYVYSFIKFCSCIYTQKDVFHTYLQTDEQPGAKHNTPCGSIKKQY